MRGEDAREMRERLKRVLERGEEGRGGLKTAREKHLLRTLGLFYM